MGGEAGLFKGEPQTLGTAGAEPLRVSTIIEGDLITIIDAPFPV
jgi:hypothetical protein